jgi:type II secretory pathway predicted ATPase ExeA
MYEATFHLDSRPFPSTPRVDLFFPAAPIEEALRTLSRCIERAEGPGMIVGGPGTGKSLLCEMLARRFSQRFHVVKLDSAQLCTRRALLQSILFALDLPYRGMDEGGLRLSLIDFLEPGETAREGMLLIIDEAHTLPLRLIEEIRMLTNLVRNGEPRARLVLAGDAKLEEHLASPRLESLNQRLAARCYLQPLNYDETLGYVRSQIAAVGGDPQRLVTDDALQAVYHASGGIPRLINQLSDHALMLLAARGGQQLYAAMIDEAWADLQQLPIPHPGDLQPPAADSGVVEFGALDDAFAAEEDDDDDTDIVEEPVWEARNTAAPIQAAAAIDLDDQLDSIEEHFQQISACDAGDGCSTTRAGVQPFAATDSPKADHCLQPDTSTCSDPTGSHDHAETAGDPFGESFAHEESVSDPYTLLEVASGSESAGRRPCSADRDFASALETIFCGQTGVAETSRDAPDVEQLPPEPPVPRNESDPQDPSPAPTQHETPAADQEPFRSAVATDFAPCEPESPTNVRESVTVDEPTVFRAHVVRSAPPDDSDLILIVDDELESEDLDDLPRRTHRRRYRDLFTRLRES